MRLRLLAVLPTVLLMVFLLPVPDSQAAVGATVDTVVDEVSGFAEAGGVRAHATDVLSEPVQAPITFSMLAFTAPPGATVSFRTSNNGGNWSAWTEAEPPEGVGPDHGTSEALRAAPDHRRSGEPMWVGSAGWLQLRVDGAPLDEVEVDLIDSMGLSRSLLQRAGDAVRSAWRGSGEAVAQAAGSPAIVPRKQWGANESFRSGAPAYASQARYAVLHHTAGSNTYTAAQAPGVVRGIYAYHTRSRGWSDIGYNFLVDRFGTIYEGRHGGIERAVIGAHALGFNTASIGVSMIGNFDGVDVPGATRSAVARLLAWKFAIHGIDPGGSVSITSTCTGNCKHAKGKAVTLPTLFGHRDVGYTACPGARGYATLPGLRSAIAKQQVDVLTNHSVAPGTVQVSGAGLSRPLDFAVDLVPAGPWEFVIKYDDGTVMHEATGRGATAKVRWTGRAGIRAGTYWYKFTSGDRAPAVGKFTVAAAAYTPPFSDDDTSVHAEGISDLYQRGITRGCTPTTFCPTRSVTREQMASFLHRTVDHLGVAQRSPTRDWFSDDGASAHQVAINTLAENGVLTGCTDATFCPKRPITRGDVAGWIANAFDLEPSGTDHFSDDDGTSYEWAINALADAGLTEGCAQGRYCDTEPTSRGQMASFLSRTIATVRSAGIVP